MRIAVLADIHGNLPALEAALAHVETLRPDRIVVVGDVVVGAPDSAACWAKIQGLGCPVLRGNHERYVFDFGTPRAKPEWATDRFGPVRWTAEQFTQAERAVLAALPMTLRLPETPGVLFVHGSPRSDSDLVFPYTPEAELEDKFAGVTEPLVVRGHNHYCGVRDWRGGRIVTVGSVGLALDGTPSAQFALLEQRTDGVWRIEHQSVPYDVAATLRRFQETGYLEQGGPVARMFAREVATASFHVVPFLEYFEKTAQPAQLSLAQAAEQFHGACG
jgi:predicted phosphodiesterase